MYKVGTQYYLLQPTPPTLPDRADTPVHEARLSDPYERCAQWSMQSKVTKAQPPDPAVLAENNRIGNYYNCVCACCCKSLEKSVLVSSTWRCAWGLGGISISFTTCFLNYIVCSTAIAAEIARYCVNSVGTWNVASSCELPSLIRARASCRGPTAALVTRGAPTTYCVETRPRSPVSPKLFFSQLPAQSESRYCRISHAVRLRNGSM